MNRNIKWIGVAILAVTVGVVGLSFRLTARPAPMPSPQAFQTALSAASAEPTLLALASPSPSPEPQKSPSSPPKITWSPTSSVEVILSPGESTSKDFAFTSDQPLQNATVEAVPGIAGFLTIQPNSFVAVSANQPQPIHLNFSIPTATALGTYDGTIHVRLGTRTVSQTLKVVVRVWKSFSDPTLRITFKYPLNLAASTRNTRTGTEVILVNPSQASPDLAVTFAFEAFPVTSVNPTVLDLVRPRLSPDGIRSTRKLYGGFLVEADDLSHFHYFQYSTGSQRGLEVYGLDESFFESEEFAAFVSTVRF